MKRSCSRCEWRGDWTDKPNAKTPAFQPDGWCGVAVCKRYPPPNVRVVTGAEAFEDEGGYSEALRVHGEDDFDYTGEQPIVYGDDWCGEFKPRN